MGVAHLWEILSPAAGEQGLKISDLSGKILAVDLSMWILEFRKSAGTNHLHNLYIRNLLYRTLEFMKEGVHLIFVLDGSAPELKHNKIQKAREKIDYEINHDPGKSNRPYLEKYSAECVDLIECLGIPWIQSPGEAEEMCAYLNQKGIVHGCITKDGDFFCYGGQTIYRNLRKESKLYVVDHFEMSDIESKLKFERTDLVSMALLLGCDYNGGGVKHVGKDKAVALLKSWRERGIKSLDRILGWDQNSELDNIEHTTKNRCHKVQHCKTCKHIGSIKIHQKEGCGQCKMEAGCNESCDVTCKCDWHKEDQLILKYKLELNIRQKSREDDDFIQRSKKVVAEFMKPDLGIHMDKDQTERRPIDLKSLMKYLSNKLHMTQDKVLEIITPVFILSQLYQNNEECMYTPIRIERTCKQSGVEGFLVSWEKTDRNPWPMADSVQVKVEKRLFTDKFPHLVRQFEDRVSRKPPPAGKRKQNPTGDNQTPRKKAKVTESNKDKVSIPDQTKPKASQKSITSFFTSSKPPSQSSNIQQSMQQPPCQTPENMDKSTNNKDPSSGDANRQPFSQKVNNRNVGHQEKEQLFPNPSNILSSEVRSSPKKEELCSNKSIIDLT